MDHMLAPFDVVARNTTIPERAASIFVLVGEYSDPPTDELKTEVDRSIASIAELPNQNAIVKP